MWWKWTEGDSGEELNNSEMERKHGNEERKWKRRVSRRETKQTKRGEGRESMRRSVTGWKTIKERGD